MTTAARFAAAAVQVLSRPADGQPPTLEEARAVTPLDVLAVPQLHLPLVQIPTRPRARSGPGVILAAVNAELTSDHARSTVAVDRYQSHDTDEPAASRGFAVDEDRRLADALHRYAATCTWAIALVDQPPFR